MRRNVASGYSPSGSGSSSTSSSTMSAVPQAYSRSQTLGVDVARFALPASSNLMTPSVGGVSYQVSGGLVRTRAADEWQAQYPPNRFHPYY